MKIQTKFFILLICLSAMMGAGTIIPGYIKIKDFEFEEAANYLKDRNRILEIDVERMYDVLNKAGVLDVQSYIDQSVGELAQKYQDAVPDPRVSSFVVEPSGTILVSWKSQTAMPSPTEIISIVRQYEDGNFQFDGFKESWNIVKQTNAGWDWQLITLMSEREMFRESWSYLQFVILVSLGMLIVVLLFYYALTDRVRERFSATVERINKFRGAEIEQFIEVDGTDEIGVLQESINSMIEKIGDEIENRKQTEVALESAKNDAEEANRAKSMFLANMSHEIRNPLNAIVGFSEVLSNTELDEQQADFTQNITRASRILTSTLSDVLELSKIESGTTVVFNEDFDVRDQIHTAFALFTLQGDDKGLDMRCDIEDNVPRKLFGDKTHLTQILNNLLQNAIKFTEVGNITIHVEVISESADFCRLGIAVSDTGIGIKANEQRLIFETFSQASGTNPGNLSGVGLGLSIVKKLVDLLGGDITLTSKPKFGSRFLVEVPFLKCKQKPGTTTESSKLDNGALANIKVLIVDDDVLNQAYIAEVLRASNIDCLKAGNGREAIEVIETNQIDVILMDIRMPVMGGVEAMQHIRQEMAPPASLIPIIVLTANVFEQDIKDYIEAGANDCINKPVRSETVLEAIHGVIHTVKDQTSNGEQL